MRDESGSTPVGITGMGVYVPYSYLERRTISTAWGARPAKGRKAIANSDEDSITMAVDAGLDCLREGGRDLLDGLIFASTSNPYDEKSQATLIGTALNLDRGISVADMGSSLRAGTAALRNAWAQVASGASREVLVVAADCRNGQPKSADELNFGDAAVALRVGSENVIATIDAQLSIQEEIVDHWRNAGDPFERTAESRFAYEEGYLHPLKTIVAKVVEQGYPLTHFDRIAISTSGPKDYLKAARSLAIDPDRLVDPMADELGVLGVPQPLLLLVRAIEQSQPGDKVLVLGHGQGFDAIVLTITEAKARLPEGGVLDRYLGRRAPFADYGRFLSFRGIIEPEPGEDFRIPASTAKTWREQDTYLRLYGSQCRQCATAVFPVNRICPSCRSMDDYDTVAKNEAVTRLFTYSIDFLAGRADDPMIVQAVVEDPADGTRMYLNLTDVDKDEVAIDMELEFTLRRIHELAGFHNYFWKARPLRRKASEVK